MDSGGFSSTDFNASFASDFRAAEEAKFRDWQEQALRRMEKLQEMGQQVQKLRATETNSDESIQVTVGANGHVQNLEISDAALKKSGKQLSADILRVMHKAMAHIPDLVRETAHTVVGADDPSTQYIMDEVGKQFPTPADLEEEDDDDSRPSREQSAAPSRPTEKAAGGNVEEIHVDIKDDDDGDPDDD